MKTTDEIFEDLETVVQDWKRKLEVIVAEGLKTIKKTTKEKKMMMKYLPGDGLIGGSSATLQARCQILSEWEGEVSRAMAAAHAQLSTLGQERAASAGEAVRALAPATAASPPPCTTVSLDFETLMRDLDTLYSKYSRMDRVNKVPIYNVQKDVMNMSHSPFPWWKPLSTYSEMINFPQPVLPTEHCQGNQKLLSLLHDFVADQKSQKTIMEDWKKMEESKKKMANSKKESKSKLTRRGRDSVQKMKERREIRKYKQFLLKEIVKKGETHYYVMKKEIAEPQNVEVEDLFEDWKHNLTPIKRPIKLTPRARKISHRAERKEMLKEKKSASERVQG